MKHQLTIRGGTIATASDTFRADLGVDDGKITAIAQTLPAGGRDIDARGRLVLPGGIETHCHIAQESSSGQMTADDYYTGSVSAAFGGNSCIVPFAAQHRGQPIADVLHIYDDRAAPNSVLDWSYHLIVTDPSEQVVAEGLPAAFEAGITSFKVFLTYDLMVVDDFQFLDILTCARRHGALTMVHAENNGMIKWTSKQLLSRGYDAPRYHAVSHPAAAEVEAVNRGIALASYVDAPLLFVHISTEQGARKVAEARIDGLKIHGETCPQYFFLQAEDLDRPGAEGAKFCCSPPLRDGATQAALWRHLRAGTFDLWSSDHAPYRFDGSGKLAAGPNPPFNRISNGMPGIMMRAPLLFSEGVKKGRITLNDFVALTSTNAAKLFGMHPRKGTIAVGADADIAIWDPDVEWIATQSEMRDAMDYTPFEGRQMTGRPVMVLSRGAIVTDGAELKAERGQGRFLPRAPYGDLRGIGQIAAELDPATNFGAQLLDGGHVAAVTKAE